MHKKIFFFIFLLFIIILPTYSFAEEAVFNFSPSALLKNQIEDNFVPGELIIELKEDKLIKTENPKLTGMASFDALSQQIQASRISPVFKNQNKEELRRFYKIELPDTSDIKKAQTDFEKLDIVKKATPNYLAKATWTPDDTYYSSQWALSKISASSAWDTTQGSSDTIIAVVDSGVDTDHPDLASKIWINTADPVNGADDDANGYIDDNVGWDWVANDGYGEYVPPFYPPGCVDRDPGDPNRTADNDPNPEPSGIDEDACIYPGVDSGQHHGTSVAGIAAAVTNNAAGVAGVCPNCTVMALRVLDDEGGGSYDQIAEAIVYAGDKGADIINMSLAGPFDDTIIDVALHSAFESGSILVAAAANGGIDAIGDDIDLPAEKLSPICNDDYDYVDGGDNEIIGVAATNTSDLKTSWSNYGKKFVDISAPGEGLHAPLNGGTYTSSFGGTSGATPIVSGVLGLVKSQNPTWDNYAVRDAAIDLIDNINSLNPSYTGKLGGRANADRAVDSGERLNPNGTLVKGSTAGIFYIDNGHKRYIPSLEVYYSHFQSLGQYVTISDSRANDYPNGPDLLFRDGTLVKSSASNNVYQIEYPNSTKRLITSAAVFLGLGYQWDDIVITSTSNLNHMPTGANISAATSHVAGALVKNNDNPEVYLLTPGTPNVKHLIVSAQIYSQYFRWQDVAIISQSELDSYDNGSDFHFQDGAVLKGTADTVYLISYGKKRPFTSPSAFTGRGYGWGQIISVSDGELTNYATGVDLN